MLLDSAIKIDDDLLGKFENNITINEQDVSLVESYNRKVKEENNYLNNSNCYDQNLSINKIKEESLYSLSHRESYNNRSISNSIAQKNEDAYAKSSLIEFIANENSPLPQ